jgi:hypothetical protein
MAINRPDTPLANTPEPQPVSSGLQPAPQMMGAVPQQRATTKYEETANNAIQQIKAMNPPPTPATPSGAEAKQQ